MPESVREVRRDELDQLLTLYRYLHPEDPALTGNPELLALWESILADPNLICLAVESGGELVSTCTLALIKNLTRGARPYAVIENVVTHPAHRGQGHSTKVLRKALAIARANDCYKVMLMTGSKDPKILTFYERAGFQSGEKAAFVVRYDRD
jgi:GNAT superfamily N-acetyltransferase